MKIKLFGRDLFEAKKSTGENMLIASLEDRNKSKYLPDFYSRIGGIEWEEVVSLNEITYSSGGVGLKGKKPKTKPKKKKVVLTPKGVYEMKMLNDKAFKIDINTKYVDDQLADFKDKLDLIDAEEYDMRNGVKEISSIVTRLENRKQYNKFKKFYDQFPYTTTTRITKMEKEHDYLKMGQVAQFIADMPKEATQLMKEYNKQTKDLCGKQAVFYIIADKKDFKKTNERRDPILLAQSPYGHFWQILGAWDKEMLFLEEL